MSKIKNLENKKICILGLGVENYALIKYLMSQKIKCNFVICDARSEKQLGDKHEEFKNNKNIQWQLGKDYDKNLKDFDVIMRSPGYPLFTPQIIKAQKVGVEINSPMKMFFDLCPSKNMIGVTGTKGKGTTSSLINYILQMSGKRVWLGGNIGVAPFEFIKKIKKNDWVILELSSFQLEDLHKSPHIAVITNFTKEHLAPADPNNPNYHRKMCDYWNAKLNILKWQTKSDKTIANIKLKKRLDPYVLKNKIIYFDKSNLESQLQGEHNQENVAAAIEVAKIAGVNQETIKKAVKKFKGLEHRLEYVNKVQGAYCYNDSFATTPDASITAIKSFASPIILLVGGADKGADFKKLAQMIKKKVKFVVLLNGVATPRIKKELLKIKYPVKQMKLVYNIKEAMETAKKNAASEDVILLSPACASFGMFANYKERGKLFKKEVNG